MIRKYIFFRSPEVGEGAGGEQPVLIGEASAEQITEWKEKYKQGIYRLVTKGHVSYFQNPSRIHMNASMSRANMDSPLDMYEQLAKLTYIGGSKEPLQNDAMFFGVTTALKTKMDGEKAVLENL